MFNPCSIRGYAFVTFTPGACKICQAGGFGQARLFLEGWLCYGPAVLPVTAPRECGACLATAHNANAARPAKALGDTERPQAPACDPSRRTMVRGGLADASIRALQSRCAHRGDNMVGSHAGSARRRLKPLGMHPAAGLCHPPVRQYAVNAVSAAKHQLSIARLCAATCRE